MKKYTVRNMRFFPSIIKKNNSPNIQLNSSQSHLVMQKSKHKKAKYKSQQSEEPNHILYYFNNSQNLKKIKHLKQRLNDQTAKQLTDKQPNDDNLTFEEKIDIEKIINPFLIKHYSKKHNLLFSSKNKSKSAFCNLSSTGSKTMSKIPSMFNGYVMRYTRFSPSELFERDRYSKEKINLKEVILNQQANQNNFTKSKLKLFQMKQSVHLYKKGKDLINRYKTCALYHNK